VCVRVRVRVCVQPTVKQIVGVLAMSSSALEVLGRSGSLIILYFCFLTVKHINNMSKLL